MPGRETLGLEISGGRKPIFYGLTLLLYGLAAIAMGPAWCLVLSIPISLSSTIITPNRGDAMFLAGASLLVSAIAFPLLHKPLTTAKIWGWPLLFSLGMAQVFGVMLVFVIDWNGSAPGEYSIIGETAIALLFGIVYGSLYWAGSVHVVYPMAMLQIWVLHRIASTGRRLAHVSHRLFD